MSIIQHLEEHLGEINRGWKDNDSHFPISVVSFEKQPFEGVTTYVTLGLSEYALPMTVDEEIRQELLFSAYEIYNSEQIASFLLTFAEYILFRKQALLRGDVIGPSKPIIFGTLLNSVYSTIPAVFEEDLTVYSEMTPPVVLTWIIPIHEEEANYARLNGWNRFEDILEEKDTDIWNLTRPLVVDCVK